MPVTRAYLSNIVRIWPLAEQEKMHAAGTPGWPDGVAIYRDEVKPRVRKAHSPDGLTERAAMLRKTSRRAGDEAIYVASLAVMAWQVEDFAQAVAAASDRNATIVVLSTGRRLPPNASAREWAEAQAEFLAERRRAQTGEGRMVGTRISAERKKADTLRRIELIRGDWPLRSHSTADLLLRAGRTPKGKRDVVPMAYAIAAEHLGPRPSRQLAHDRAIEREAKRKEKRDGKRKR